MKKVSLEVWFHVVVMNKYQYIDAGIANPPTKKGNAYSLHNMIFFFKMMIVFLFVCLFVSSLSFHNKFISYLLWPLKTYSNLLKIMLTLIHFQILLKAVRYHWSLLVLLYLSLVLSGAVEDAVLIKSVSWL